MRTVLHFAVLYFEQEIKTSVDCFSFVPAQALSVTVIRSLPQSVAIFKVTVPKILAANIGVILATNGLVWLGKYILLVIKVLKYNSMERQTYQPTFKSPPDRVLIVHGSVGAGHKRAAQALSETFEQNYPEIVVEVVDIVDFAGTFFNAVYKTGYLSLSEKTWGSHLVGYFFDAGNTERPGWAKRLIQEVRVRELQRMGSI